MPEVFRPITYLPSEPAKSPEVAGLASADALLTSIVDRQKQKEEAERYRLVNLYYPKQAESELAKSALEMQYLPLEKESKLREEAARTGLLGTQAKAAALEAQYYPRSKEAEIANILSQIDLRKAQEAQLPLKLEMAAQSQRQKELAKPIATSQKEAQDALDQLNDLDIFHENYKNLSGAELGAVGGLLPGFTSSAQQADAAANRLAANIARAIGGSRATVYGLKFAFGLKPSRRLNPKAEENMVEALRSALKRKVEYADFFSRGSSMGLNEGEINNLWRNYNNQYPEYNPTTGKPLFSNKYESFFNPDVVKSFKETGKVPLLINKEEFKKLSPLQQKHLHDDLIGQ